MRLVGARSSGTGRPPDRASRRSGLRRAHPARYRIARADRGGASRKAADAGRDSDMTKAAIRLAAAVLALAGLGQAGFAAGTEPVAGPPARTAWTVAEGYSGYSGIDWPGPGWSWPLPTPKRGCYAFDQRLNGALRKVVVCE